MKEQLKKMFSDPKLFASDTKSEPYINVESPDDISPTYYKKKFLIEDYAEVILIR